MTTTESDSGMIRPGDVQPPDLSIRIRNGEYFVEVTGRNADQSETDTAFLPAPIVRRDPGGPMFSEDRSDDL